MLALVKTQPQIDEILRIHEYERQRLGQELHDSAGQLVVSLHLSIARLKRLEENHHDDGVLAEMEATVSQIDKEIRSLAFLHYPAELGDCSVSASIERLALGFGRRTGIRTSFESSGDSPPLDDAVSTALLRVTQEALVNVHRHSRATSVKVELRRRPGSIELRVSDNGVGIAPDQPGKPTGIGLKGMRHRIEAAAGRFEVRALEPGTLIRAFVPLAVQA